MVVSPKFEPRSVTGLEEIPVGLVPGDVRWNLHAGFCGREQVEIVGKHTQPDEERADSSGGLVLQGKVRVAPTNQLLDQVLLCGAAHLEVMLGIGPDRWAPKGIDRAGEGGLFHDWRGPNRAEVGEQTNLKDVAKVAEHGAAQRMPGVKIERNHSLLEQTGGRMALAGGKEIDVERAEQFAIGAQLYGEMASGVVQAPARRDDLTVEIVEAIFEIAVVERYASRIVAGDEVVEGKMRGRGAIPSGENQLALRPHHPRARECLQGCLLFRRIVGCAHDRTLDDDTDIVAGICRMRHCF